MSRSTREMIRDFNLAFGRPVNEEWTELTKEERVLLGKLLLEETLEYCIKGLGLEVLVQHGQGSIRFENLNEIDVQIDDDAVVDPVEMVDGLADVNVVVHFCAHWHGFNLDVATEIVNDSNMSKLDPATGKAILNGITEGYRNYHNADDEPGFDPSKPIGKILKGKDYWEPTHALRQLIFEGNNR